MDRWNRHGIFKNSKKAVAKAKNEAWERRCRLIDACVDGEKRVEAW